MFTSASVEVNGEEYIYTIFWNMESVLEENDLVCGQYILRFRLVDWAHRLTARRQTVLLAG